MCVERCSRRKNSLEPVSHFFYSHRLKLQFWDWGTDGKPVHDSGARRPGSRPQLGLGGAGAARRLSRLCARSARARQQRVGSGSAVQRRRTRAGSFRAGRYHQRVSGLHHRAFAGRGGDAAVCGRVSGSRKENRGDRRRRAAARRRMPQTSAGRPHARIGSSACAERRIARRTAIPIWRRPWRA